MTQIPNLHVMTLNLQLMTQIPNLHVMTLNLQLMSKIQNPQLRFGPACSSRCAAMAI
jgi:hypothetical protein